MLEKLKDTIEFFEQMKEIQRIQYDYFKHLTTLSSGAILIVVAFIGQVFNHSVGIFFAFASIIAFILALAISLWALPLPGNTILYINVIIQGVAEGDENKAMEGYNKAEKSIKNIGSCRYTYLHNRGKR